MTKIEWGILWFVGKSVVKCFFKTHYGRCFRMVLFCMFKKIWFVIVSCWAYPALIWNDHEMKLGNMLPQILHIWVTYFTRPLEALLGLVVLSDVWLKLNFPCKPETKEATIYCIAPIHTLILFWNLKNYNIKKLN